MTTTKDRILERSFDLFLRNNYDSVSLMQIQEASGISRGAIYHHFRSKEHIFRSTVDKFLLPAFSTYSLLNDEEKNTLQETIYASIKCRQNHVNFLKSITSIELTDFHFFKFAFQATEHYPEFSEQINLITEKEFNGWRNIVQKAMRTGEIRADLDIDYTTQMFITTPFGLGVFSAFSKYINISTKDIRTSYTRLYALLKKQNFG